MNTKRSILSTILTLIAAIAIIIFCLFPVVQLVSISFKPQPEWGNVNLIPKNPTTENYKEVMGITSGALKGRKDEFQKQFNVKDARALPEELRASLTERVNAWIDKTPDAESYIGKFSELKTEVKAFQREIRKELEAAGMDRGAANSVVKNGIEGPVPYRVLSSLSATDAMPEKQKAILAEFIKKGVSFGTYFRNSFIFSMVSSCISVFMAIFGSYALARLKFVGRETVSKTVLLTYMVGGVLLLVPLYQMAAQLGFLRNGFTRAAFLMIIYIMQTLPVSLYMLGNYFRTISFSLEEAAAVDGYNRMETIFKIVLPLSLPMVATVFIYCFVIAWNEYLFMASFLKEYDTFWTLPIGLNELISSANYVDGKISAASILTLVPVVVLFGYAIRHMNSGLSEGGVKE